MRRFLGLMLLTIALLMLGFRGMQRVRSEVPMWDFASVYAAARTWVHGGNPYDVASVIVTWRESGVYADRDVSYFATVYPPTSLVTLVPLALLPGGWALGGWLLITVGLLAMQFAALADMAWLSWRDPRMLILLGGSLASAPYQFGILSGQLSIPAISLCIGAFWCVRRDREKLAGVLLGLACALKPQIAGPFVLYYLVLRRWSVSASAVLVGGAIGVAALAAMHMSHVAWLAGWTQSIAATGRVGGVNDYGWAGDFRDEIVDLKMLLVSVLHDTRPLRIVVEGITLILAIWYVCAFPRGRSRTSRDDLLALSALSAIALLPIYHRVYDVALLTPALAWALAELDGARRRYALALLVPMAVFLIPFDIVEAVGHRKPSLGAMAKTGWWQTLIAPHYAWGLLALTIILLWTMSGVVSRSTRPAGGISPA